MPPIFQPEAAADAIVYASEARRREVWVGSSSFKAILGNKVAPSFLDRYLARFGYTSQYSSEPAQKDAPDNLFKPIEGDFGAHGRFNNEAQRTVDIQTPVLPWLAAVAGAAAGLAFVRFKRNRILRDAAFGGSSG